MAGFSHSITGNKGIGAAQKKQLDRLNRPDVVLMEIGLYLKDKAIERLDERDITDSFGGRVTTGLLGKGINTEHDGPRGTAITQTDSEYAMIQQKGGPIKPIPPRKAIAIPATRQLKRSGKWPRDFPKGELKFIPSTKAGHCIGILVEARSAERVRASDARFSKYKTSIERKLKKELRTLYTKTKKGQLNAKQNHIRQVYARLKHEQQMSVARSQATKAQYKIMFILMDEVTIPARPYLFVDEEAKIFASKRLAKYIATG